MALSITNIWWVTLPLCSLLLCNYFQITLTNGNLNTAITRMCQCGQWRTTPDPVTTQIRVLVENNTLLLVISLFTGYYSFQLWYLNQHIDNTITYYQRYSARFFNYKPKCSLRRRSRSYYISDILSLGLSWIEVVYLWRHHHNCLIMSLACVTSVVTCH